MTPRARQRAGPLGMGRNSSLHSGTLTVHLPPPPGVWLSQSGDEPWDVFAVPSLRVSAERRSNCRVFSENRDFPPGCQPQIQLGGSDIRACGVSA